MYFKIKNKSNLSLQKIVVLCYKLVMNWYKRLRHVTLISYGLKIIHNFFFLNGCMYSCRQIWLQIGFVSQVYTMANSFCEQLFDSQLRITNPNEHCQEIDGVLFYSNKYYKSSLFTDLKHCLPCSTQDVRIWRWWPPGSENEIFLEDTYSLKQGVFLSNIILEYPDICFYSVLNHVLNFFFKFQFYSWVIIELILNIYNIEKMSDQVTLDFN